MVTSPRPRPSELECAHVRRQLLGTTVDLSPALRDTVLAGVFAAFATWSATQLPVFFVFGLLSGGMLGFVLHLLPPEPLASDNPTGRIVIRAVTGGITGAILAPGLAWLSSGAAIDAAPAPSSEDMLLAAALGLVTGIAWYVIWGLWETRVLRAARKVA